MLELCTLGTGGTLPLADRALSSLYVRENGRAMIIDCGEGTQSAARAAGVSLMRMDLLALTHYHGDHIFGIPGLLQDPDQHLGIQPLKGTEDGETADELGNHPEPPKIFVGHLVEDVFVIVKSVPELCPEAERGLFSQTFTDNGFEIGESSSADKEDIAGVHCGQRHHGVFAAGAHWHFYLTTL